MNEIKLQKNLNVHRSYYDMNILSIYNVHTNTYKSKLIKCSVNFLLINV